MIKSTITKHGDELKNVVYKGTKIKPVEFKDQFSDQTLGAKSIASFVKWCDSNKITVFASWPGTLKPDPEEILKDGAVTDAFRIELHLYRFGVAGPTGGDVFVGRVEGCATGVPDLGIDHTGQGTQQILYAPEAATR